MRICKCLCAAIALGVIACYANNGYASEPNLSLKEKVALRMASAPGNAAIQDSAVKEIEKGKVTLKKAGASGKYAQGVLVQNFALNDDSQEANNVNMVGVNNANMEVNNTNAGNQNQLSEAEKREKEIEEKLREINSRNSADPNANAIKWWTPKKLPKDDSSKESDKTNEDNPGPGKNDGWTDCWDLNCCCCCCTCPPTYPYVIDANGCDCGFNETESNFGCYDFGYGYIDDCPCSFDCDEICKPARPCPVRSVVSRVISRVGVRR